MADNGSGGQTSVTLVIPSAHPSAPPASPVPTVVVHPRPHLPFTGIDAATWLALAVLLIAVGALLLVKGRIRPAAHPRST